MRLPCMECGGTGKHAGWPPKEPGAPPCQKCGGTGAERARRVQKGEVRRGPFHLRYTMRYNTTAMAPEA